MKVKYLSHAGFQVSFGDTTLVIDPFLTGNQLAPVKPEEIRGVDLVLVTHLHDDHVGDAVAIALANDASIVGSYDLVTELQKREPKVKVVGMNIGGTYLYKDVRITLVHATHVAPLGTATGFVIRRDKISLYHAGDTGLFSDMELFAKRYGINVAMLPIGGYYTMDIPDAVEAVKMIKPKIAIPMHYNTFPEIEADPYVFKRIVEEETDTAVVVLKPGEEKEIKVEV